MKIEELQQQTTDELRALFVDLSEKIFKQKNENSATGKVEKTHLIRKQKRNRARILTILRQRGETL